MKNHSKMNININHWLSNWQFRRWWKNSPAWESKKYL